MKKITLIFLFVFCGAFGQASYTSADFAQIGDSFLVSHAVTGLTGLDFAVTGQGYQWNYSGLTASSQQTLSYINPVDSGYKTTWCLLNAYLLNCTSQFDAAFNLAAPVSEGIELEGYGLTNLTAHYKLSTADLKTKMLGASISVAGVSLPFTVDYEDPDEVYDFPMTYGTSITHTSGYDLDLNTFGVPLEYIASSQRTNEVEGWGYLATPYGNFNNVLKMKTTLVVNDTIVTATDSVPVQRTTISYKWFDTTKGIPVLEVDGDLVNNVWLPINATYLDNPLCLDPIALFGFFPVVPAIDPETYSAAVSFVNASTNYNTLAWQFPDGTSSTSANPDFSFLCPGTYQVTLTVTNTFCEPNLVDSVLLPLVISDPDSVFTTDVEVSETTLTALRNVPNTTYQWLSCTNNMEPIPGATTASYVPGNTGSYAVQLTTNGCVSVSDCYSTIPLGVSTFETHGYRLVPNPTTGKFDIPGLSSEATLSIFDLLGKQVGSGTDVSGVPSGLYFVKVATSSGEKVLKLVKH